MIDWFFIILMLLLFIKLKNGSISLHLFLQSPVDYLFQVVRIRHNFPLLTIILIVYFVAIPYLSQGYTLGKRIVNIKIISLKASLKFIQVLVREIVFYMFLGLFLTLIYLAFIENKSSLFAFEQELLLLGSLMLLSAYFIVDIFLVAFQQERFFYEKISRTELVNSLNSKNDESFKNN